MIWLSEILIQEHQLCCFEDVMLAVKERATAGERFFGIDIKPQFPDTPNNWEAQLESIFTARIPLD
jgi:hypothetical protein